MELPKGNNRPRGPRGFALLFVMLLVALLGIGSAALLDLVSIDLSVAGEHAKTLAAEAASIGAALEVVGEPDFIERLGESEDQSSNLRTVLVDRVAGSYVVNPSGTPPGRTLTEATSAHVRNVGTPLEDGYVADVRFLKVVNLEDTGVNYGTGVYEVRVRASVAGGDASREARIMIHRPVAIRPDSRVPHAR